MRGRIGRIGRIGGNYSVLAIMASLIISSVAQPVDTGASELGRLPILQGATNAAMTELAVLAEAAEIFYSELLTPEGETLLPVWEDEKLFPGSKWSVLKFRFDGLQPGVDYRLVVRDGSGKIRDQRVLRSLDLSRVNARIALVSCMNDKFLQRQGRYSAQLAAVKPDLIFFLGDNSYTDRDGKTNPAMIWRRYSETRRDLNFFRIKRLIPVLATWDDHDYGVNNGDETYRYKNEAREIFDAFFAQDTHEAIPELAHGPGVSTYFSGFGQEFLLLDDRTFRAPSRSGGRHWGHEQEEWLHERLKAARSPVWIMNGSQFFGAYHRAESVEREHPDSLEALLEVLREIPVPVVFASGDLHYSEVMRLEPEILGYTSYELTSSGLLATEIPLRDSIMGSNPRRMASTWRNNFITVETRVPSADTLAIEGRSVGGDGGARFQFGMEVAR